MGLVLEVIFYVLLLASFLGLWLWWQNSTRAGAEWLLRDEIVRGGFGEALRKQGLQAATDQLMIQLVRVWNDSRGGPDYVPRKNDLERVYEMAKRARLGVHALWDDYLRVGPCGVVANPPVVG